MANHKSALKRIRVNKRRRLENRLHISRSRTEVRHAREAIASGDLEAARRATLIAIRVLDKAVRSGALHRNNAARRKSRLMARLNALEAAQKA
ncbi:MAG: 30S ribosomal protein S20 [Anaerolineae bacterium]|nr:30S ribosomal protein S20 [Anaerolineae bacterium]MDW8299209.1 30S ribosomal protein S20 [Anaerolineae bacterium]